MGQPFGKLRWYTERRRRMVDFCLTLAHATIIARWRVRRVWTYPRRHVVDVDLTRQILTADALHS